MNPIFTTVCLALMSIATAWAQGDGMTSQNLKTSNDSTTMPKKILVTFFSHTGENYAVGHIDKGNTHIVAEMIAAETGGTLFEIVPASPYPEAYDDCVDVAKKEKDTGARPAIATDTAVEDYDVIFIGFPNWWGDMPMAVYTFAERHAWTGRTVLPFCTHEGSGLGSIPRRIAATCAGATLGDGLAIRGATAQNRRDDTRRAVRKWLDKLGF